MSEVLVLCYHGISETWPAETTVAPGDLERQIGALAAAGYEGATLTAALTAPPARRTLVVTFDDAHRSVLDLAAPILERFDVPGTVFVPTDYAGSARPMAWSGNDAWLGTEHEHELRCMTWDELAALDQSGWEVGSHTCSHPRLSELPDERIRMELGESRACCEERLGKPCLTLAYPYSDYDDRVVAAARTAGYALATTVPRRGTPPLPLQWPRVGVYNGDSTAALRARILRRRVDLVPLAGRVSDLVRRLQAGRRS